MNDRFYTLKLNFKKFGMKFKIKSKYSITKFDSSISYLIAINRKEKTSSSHTSRIVVGKITHMEYVKLGLVWVQSLIVKSKLGIVFKVEFQISFRLCRIFILKHLELR